MTTYGFTNETPVKCAIPSSEAIIKSNSNLKSSVVATNGNLEGCAALVNAILRFLNSNEVEMPIPSEQGDNFSAYSDITRERSARVLDGLNQIADALGIDL